MAVTPPPLTAHDLSALRQGIAGRVVAPGDADYDPIRALVYGGFDFRPGAIVRARDAQDVAMAIGLARTSGVPLAVRSGGHSLAGHSSNDGGLVIDLRDMKAIDIDPIGSVAWAEAGATAAEFTAALVPHGLAVGFGDAGSVGISGITLGGGVGYLSRRYGLTIDSLLAVEIVTADGRILLVDAEQHSDLFWAVRGGGGNFGVVTRLRYRLRELKEFVGGMLMLPATADTVAGFIAAAAAAPEALSTIANVMPAPPMPFVPAELHGKPVIFGMLAFSGGEAAAVAALAPFRALAPPIMDAIKPGPLTSMYPPEDPNYHPTAVARTMFVDEVGREEAQTVLDRLAASNAPMRVTQLRVLGGAIDRVPAGDTAYAHRGSRIMVNIAAFHAGPADRAEKAAWVDDLAGALRQGDQGAYVNFLGDEGEARIRAAYPDRTWERLREVKRRYDPGNLFRLNQNIVPAA